MRTKKQIFSILNTLNQEQLNLFYNIGNDLINYHQTKQDLIGLVYDSDEMKNIDCAMPLNALRELQQVNPDTNSFYYVMNYNQNPLGKIEHLGEELLKRLPGRFHSI